MAVRCPARARWIDAIAMRTIIITAVAGVKLLEHGWQQIRQILGQKTGSERGGRGTMHPDRGGGRDERLHALREQTEHDTAQYIA